MCVCARARECVSVCLSVCFLRIPRCGSCERMSDDTRFIESTSMNQKSNDNTCIARDVLVCVYIYTYTHICVPTAMPGKQRVGDQRRERVQYCSAPRVTLCLSHTKPLHQAKQHSNTTHTHAHQHDKMHTAITQRTLPSLERRRTLPSLERPPHLAALSVFAPEWPLREDNAQRSAQSRQTADRTRRLRS